MTMKKNVLALAVSGGLVAAPMAATAAPEVYGLVDIGVESFNDSDGVAAGTIFGGLNSVDGTNSTDGFTSASRSDAKDLELTNGLQSNFGVRGSEEITGDLTASYKLEFAVDVLDEDGGTIGNAFGTRLGWAALGGDWGTVKVGSQWQPLYIFGGWNTHRTDVHGYGSYYYATGELSNSLSFGFRQSSAISYQYGNSPWGHSDPFAFNVTLAVGEGNTTSAAVTEDLDVVDGAGNPVVDENGDPVRETRTIAEETDVTNEEGISSIQVAGQYSFDKRISVNAVYVKEFNDFDRSQFNKASEAAAANREVQLINLGGRWSVTDALELGVNYTRVDRDAGDDDIRETLAIASFMDFGNGLSGHLGFANGSDDRAGVQEIDLNTYGYIKQALSDRTDVRLELENIQFDNAQDSSATVALVALQHNF